LVDPKAKTLKDVVRKLGETKRLMGTGSGKGGGGGGGGGRLRLEKKRGRDMQRGKKGRGKKGAVSEKV